MQFPKIKVVGVGGSGSNAVSRMRRYRVEGVELIAINTDYQDLQKAKADVKIRIGKEATHGLGTGMKPQVGEAAARESADEIRKALEGADMVFVTYGAGGGTGTGAGPVVAGIAKELGSLTVAVVTTPFAFEGRTRQNLAREGIEKLKPRVDSLIRVHNDKLLDVLDEKVTVDKAFWFCDEILREAVHGIADLIMRPGIINVDFADIRSVLENSGTAVFRIGRGKGDKRARDAVQSAFSTPLLDAPPKGAKGILFNVSGGEDISLAEIEEIGDMITERINPSAQVIFGAVQGEKIRKGEIKVTIIATGF